MSDTPWIDVEDKLPPIGEHVIVLIPFGMRVEDDYWTERGWLNGHGYVSHWQPLKQPGSYKEIMERPRGDAADASWSDGDRRIMQELKADEMFSAAVVEHGKMMAAITATQLAMRLEARNTDRSGDAAK